MRAGRFALLTFASGFPGALAFAYAGQEIARMVVVFGIRSPESVLNVIRIEVVVREETVR